MAKPHEMTLVVHKESPNHRPEIRDETGRSVAVVYVAYKSDGRYSVPQHEEAEGVAVFLAAAPAMARALLGCGRFAVEPNGDADVWHTEACWRTGRAMCLSECSQARDALRKAGVIS
jgi:hypothetical protein